MVCQIEKLHLLILSSDIFLVAFCTDILGVYERCYYLIL